MLSLSKLALLASDEPEDEVVDCIRRINKELTLIAHQEDVSADVLETYGYDINKLRVLSPTELITVRTNITVLLTCNNRIYYYFRVLSSQLYTCEENAVANVYDFKKALDLLKYVEPREDRPILKLRIWARAARRDRWDTVSKNPEQQVKETMFFKMMDLAHSLGESSTQKQLGTMGIIEYDNNRN